MARGNNQSLSSVRSEINPFRKGGTFEDADASAQLKQFDKKSKEVKSILKDLRATATSALTANGKKQSLNAIEDFNFTLADLAVKKNGGEFWAAVDGEIRDLTDKIEKSSGVIAGYIPTYSVKTADRWSDGDTVAVIVKGGVANVVNNLDYDIGELHIKNLRDGFKAHFQLDEDYGAFKTSKLETIKLEKYDKTLIDNLERKHGSVKLFNFDTSGA
jgi:hypothetical protein